MYLQNKGMKLMRTIVNYKTDSDPVLKSDWQSCGQRHCEAVDIGYVS